MDLKTLPIRLMDWMVISRVRQNTETYALAFSKTFANCKDNCEHFEIGKSLLRIVIDWCDAEINGLGKAIGRENDYRDSVSTGLGRGKKSKRLCLLFK